MRGLALAGKTEAPDDAIVTPQGARVKLGLQSGRVPGRYYQSNWNDHAVQYCQGVKTCTESVCS